MNCLLTSSFVCIYSRQYKRELNKASRRSNTFSSHQNQKWYLNNFLYSSSIFTIPIYKFIDGPLIVLQYQLSQLKAGISTILSKIKLNFFWEGESEQVHFKKFNRVRLKVKWKGISILKIINKKNFCCHSD